MRAFFILLLCVRTAICFDLESIDSTNANWFPCDSSRADITIKITSHVLHFFDREDSFDFRYDGPKYSTNSEGGASITAVGSGSIPIPSFEANGNKGWIYVKETAADGIHIRCVVRERPDNGKVLYEKEFIIPWSQKAFSLRTDNEQFDTQIIANANK